MFLHNFLFPFIIFASYSFIYSLLLFLLSLWRLYTRHGAQWQKCIYFKSVCCCYCIRHSNIFFWDDIFFAPSSSSSHDSFQQIFNNIVLYIRYLHQHHHHLLVRCNAFFILIQVTFGICTSTCRRKFCDRTKKTHQIAYTTINIHKSLYFKPYLQLLSLYEF